MESNRIKSNINATLTLMLYLIGFVIHHWFIELGYYQGDKNGRTECQWMNQCEDVMNDQQ